MLDSISSMMFVVHDVQQLVVPCELCGRGLKLKNKSEVNHHMKSGVTASLDAYTSVNFTVHHMS